MRRQVHYFHSGKDDMFLNILRDYAHDYAEKAPQTDDFLKIVERDAPADWRFFFESWINRAEIPSYSWNYKIDPDAAGSAITLNFERSDVRVYFATLIPIRFDYEDGTSGMIFVPNRKNEQTLTQKVQKKVKAVVFAPDHSLLAKVRKG